jgi:hypothetical protein
MDNPQISPLAIISLILSIVAILAALPGCLGCLGCFGCMEVPFSVGALITGFIAVTSVNADPESVGGKGLAMAGTVGTEVVAILINLGWILSFSLFGAMASLTN